MAFDDQDWYIDYENKKIGNQDNSVGANFPATLGNTSKVGTVLAFFQWCASTFAASTQMDDDYAFVSDTPTVYRWVNDWGFQLDGSDYKYLSGGSIASADVSLLWSNLYSIGSQTEGTQLYMIQNNVEVIPWQITGNVDNLVEVKRNGQFIYSKNTSDVSTAGGVKTSEVFFE